MKVCIIGGGAGGASAAARLRRLDEHAEILLIEKGPYISYANCGLPYYIGGTIRERSALTIQTPERFYERFRIKVRTETEVIRISSENKELALVHDGVRFTEHYDKLILSPGATPYLPNVPGIDDERVFTLRDIPDTDRIADFIRTRHPRRALIVGAGAVGLELCENFMQQEIETVIVDAANHAVTGIDPDMACYVHKGLRRKGIPLHFGKIVTALETDDTGITALLNDNSFIKADMVLLCAGVRPASKLASDAGLQLNRNGTIKVDEHMQTSEPDIYAVGDAIGVTQFVSGDSAYIPLAGPANRQGRIAADNICGLRSSYHGTQGTSILKLFDQTLAYTGINEAAAKLAGIPYDSIWLTAASNATYYPGATTVQIKVLFEKKSGRILGAQLYGAKGVDKRCDVFATAIRANMTAQDLLELELSYAPPYGSAKDPVNMAGFAIENILNGLIRQHHCRELSALQTQRNSVFLDVRTAKEFSMGSIPGAKNVPLHTLRDRLLEFDKDKVYYINCQSGLRSYIACRILSQNGIQCSNLAGGYQLYEILRQESLQIR